MLMSEFNRLRVGDSIVSDLAEEPLVVVAKLHPGEYLLETSVKLLSLCDETHTVAAIYREYPQAPGKYETVNATCINDLKIGDIVSIVSGKGNIIGYIVSSIDVEETTVTVTVVRSLSLSNPRGWEKI